MKAKEKAAIGKRRPLTDEELAKVSGGYRNSGSKDGYVIYTDLEGLYAIYAGITFYYNDKLYTMQTSRVRGSDGIEYAVYYCGEDDTTITLPVGDGK